MRETLYLPIETQDSTPAGWKLTKHNLFSRSVYVVKVLPEKYYSFKLLIKNFEGYVGNQLVKLSVDVKITYKKKVQ